MYFTHVPADRGLPGNMEVLKGPFFFFAGYSGQMSSEFIQVAR